MKCFLFALASAADHSDLQIQMMEQSLSAQVLHDLPVECCHQMAELAELSGDPEWFQMLVLKNPWMDLTEQEPAF